MPRIPLDWNLMRPLSEVLLLCIIIVVVSAVHSDSRDQAGVSVFGKLASRPEAGRAGRASDWKRRAKAVLAAKKNVRRKENKSVVHENGSRAMAELKEDLAQQSQEILHQAQEISSLKDEMKIMGKSDKKLHKKVAMELQESSWAKANMDGSRRPTVMKDGLAKAERRSLADRMRYLERKVDGATNWLENPQLWRLQQYECKNRTSVGTDDEHHVCLDGWEKQRKEAKGKPCIVYDLGIRANPEFGANMMKTYGCHVRAYDPSQIASKWWNGSEASDVPAASLRKYGPEKYKFQKFAASGLDGNLSLYEFNWNQISIVHDEVDLTRPEEEQSKHQEEVKVQAKTLPTMMKDNGDNYMDVLKVDIEGSEYAFLQQAFDTMGCPPVGQMTLEFHNFDLDERYGSSSEINTIHNLLNSCGFKSFRVRDSWRNFVSDKEESWHVPPKRFTLASYCRKCVAE